ncbi:MAG: TlpA family protein disulfide reductase [Pyrinomonadaceae bacterium]
MQFRLKMLAVPVFAIIVFAAGNNFAQNSNPSKTNTATAQTKDAETIDFNFTDFTGKPRKFSEFRGKYVLLDFWATWCRPCLADIPKLKELYEKHEGEGFEIIGMDSETIGDDGDAPDPEFAKETAARARQIVTTRGVMWTQATAETAIPVANKVFGVKALPTKVLIDKDGKIIATIGEKDDLKAIVEKLFDEKK